MHDFGGLSFVRRADEVSCFCRRCFLSMLVAEVPLVRLHSTRRDIYVVLTVASCDVGFICICAL